MARRFESHQCGREASVTAGSGSRPLTAEQALLPLYGAHCRHPEPTILRRAVLPAFVREARSCPEPTEIIFGHRCANLVGAEVFSCISQAITRFLLVVVRGVSRGPRAKGLCIADRSAERQHEHQAPCRPKCKRPSDPVSHDGGSGRQFRWSSGFAEQPAMANVRRLSFSPSRSCGDKTANPCTAKPSIAQARQADKHRPTGSCDPLSCQP